MMVKKFRSSDLSCFLSFKNNGGGNPPLRGHRGKRTKDWEKMIR